MSTKGHETLLFYLFCTLCEVNILALVEHEDKVLKLREVDDVIPGKKGRGRGRGRGRGGRGRGKKGKKGKKKKEKPVTLGLLL